MDSDEIGLAELVVLWQRNWKLVLGLAAACGIAAFVALSLFTSVVYSASARLVLSPSTQDTTEANRPVDFYRSLLESDLILQKTTEKLVADGALPGGAVLRLGKELDAHVESSDTASSRDAVLILSSRAATPDLAAKITNTWARVFVEESRTMLKSSSAEAEKLLVEQLAPTRQKIEELERERSHSIDLLQDREDQVATQWDDRIAAANAKSASTLAEYQSETRRLMEECAGRYWPDLLASGQVPGGETSMLPEVSELVSVRAELARTPRILNLEKTPNDESLADVILRGKDANVFESTLISQEVNPLYDQLSVRALDLEGQLKRIAGDRLFDASRGLVELEKIQRERAAGLEKLVGQRDLELRGLRRRRDQALQDLARERLMVMTESERKLKQLGDLESHLADRHNKVFLSGLMEGLDRVSLAAPAVPRRVAEPRRRLLKASVAAFLGGLLGLVITLVRSAGLPAAPASAVPRPNGSEGSKSAPLPG